MKKSTTKTALFDKPWTSDTTIEQYIDLEVFLNWLKETVQEASPTSDGVKLIIQASQDYDNEQSNLLISWEEQETKTSKRVKKAIGKIKRKPRKGKTK